MFYRRFFVIVLAVAALSCGGGSPLAPAPIPTPDPTKPADGTQVINFPLPGTNEPLKVWISGLSPAIGSQLKEGEVYSVGIKCTGPSGYGAHVGVDFISDPSEPLVQNGPNGMYFDLPGSVHTTGGRYANAYKGMPEVKYARINAWVGKLPEIREWFPPRPPDYHFDQWLGYISPK